MKTRHQPAAQQKSGKNYGTEEEAKQRWTEKLDLVSWGHALVLTLYIVALFVWDGQHLDVLDCSLISLAGSGGKLPSGSLKSSILCHFMASLWGGVWNTVGLLVLTPSCLGQMGRIGLGRPNRSPSSRYYLGSEFLVIPAHRSFLQGTCYYGYHLTSVPWLNPWYRVC